jgi:hypothetical protein
MDDCTRYAANFDRDRIDESILPELDASTLRSLGLREGDVIRVSKIIKGRYGKKTPEQTAQLSADEEYARKLQEHEDSGGKGPTPAPPPGLFTNADGKLANHTRRGRPERRNTLTSNTVDTAALGAVSEQLTKVSLTPLEPTKTPVTPPEKKEEPKEVKKEEPPKTLLTGFDDDAWEIKPTAKSSKPASPAPVPSPKTASPAPKPNGTDALLAQISSMRPASADPPRGGNFDVLAELPSPQNVQAQQRSNSVSAVGSMPPPSSYGLGAGNATAPMSQLQQPQIQQPQMQQQVPQLQQPQMPDPNAPRGPLAPVRANEGLLNPLQPTMTGMFVPTHQTGFQSPMGMQPTGMGMGGGMLSPGGYQQPIQPAYTGLPTFQQQQQNSSFNAIANLPPPQVPQPTGAGDKFAPSNIFSAMKRTDFGKSEEATPQSASECRRMGNELPRICRADRRQIRRAPAPHDGVQRRAGHVPAEHGHADADAGHGHARHDGRRHAHGPGHVPAGDGVQPADDGAVPAVRAGVWAVLDRGRV